MIIRRILLIAVAVFMAAAVNAQTVYTEASKLTLVGKIHKDTPNPYHRVDTVKFKGFSKSENLQVRMSSGIAVAFRTNSTSISVKTVYGTPGWPTNTNGISGRGYDLYIRQDGKWIYAASGVAPDDDLESKLVLIKSMDGNMKECLLYLPTYSEVNPIWGGEEYNAGLTAVFEDKVTHKNISLITGALPEEKEANKQAALLLRKIDKEYNSERVPSFILLDYNAGYKSHSFMSTQNYWCDTYALQRALRDPMIATKTSDRPEHQSSRSDIVGLAHFVQNNAVALSHKVLRSESSISAHFPVTAEIVIK